MSIITDANYVKLNYKNSENTYENLTPKIFVNGVGYNSNSIAYQLNRNNIASTNVADAITEIEGRVAQCGRKFDELEFGVGKDIDLLDNAGNQITLNTYYIGNIVYFPKAQKYYMLLYSFTYSRSVLLASDDGILWELDSDTTTWMLIDVKCNSQHIFFIGYTNTSYPVTGYPRRGLYYPTRINNLLDSLKVKDTYGIIAQLPTTQYDLGNFLMSFDMDENSMLCLSLNTYGYETAYRTDNLGNFTQIYRVKSQYHQRGIFPKILNINPGQYVYYVKGQRFAPKLISITQETQDDVVIETAFPDLHISDILLTNEFACTNLYEALFARTDDGTGLNSELKYIIISNPKDIKIEPSDLFAPPILLAKKCCNNYVFYTSAFRGRPANRKWAYLNRLMDFGAGRTVSLNDNNGDNIGDNYIIATGFNPSFINKINDKLFIYTNNEVNSTTLNNSKLYISQIKI